MGEIQEIMRQFCHGGDGCQWHKFLRSIKIENIHGWTGQEVKFNFPVVAIVGENGIGKSTFLKAAACAYKNSAGKSFYPSKMFVSTRWDAAALSHATINYKIKQGTAEKALRWKKTNDWGFAPKTGKPERYVYFLDISRTLPLDATAGYEKIAKEATGEAGTETVFTAETLHDLSYVLGQSYGGARFVGTNVNVDREVGLLTRENGEISQFHQGAGEDSILDMFRLLQDIPTQSLLIIDEVENSLHPQAQRRFIRYLLKLARTKKIQIILSTHSPFVLEELPSVARIMLMRTAEQKNVVYEVSTQFALSTIDDIHHPELYVFLEDDEAVLEFWEILKQDEEHYSEYLSKISASAVGSCDVVRTLDGLAKNHRLPYKSLCVVDGDKRETMPEVLALPGTMAPEKQVFTDLKNIEWNKLDDRFGIGAGTLFKYLEDAMLEPDHHKWTEYVGDRVRKSKDVVWGILVGEWCKQCLGQDVSNSFIEMVRNALI